MALFLNYNIALGDDWKYLLAGEQPGDNVATYLSAYMDFLNKLDEASKRNIDI